MKRILFPKYYYEVQNNPVIFLSGPIHAAPNWQKTAAKMILKKTKDIVVASPRQFDLNIPLNFYSDATHVFYRQRPWEKYYMNRAAYGGSILFWLPDSDKRFLSTEMVYGATTRFELGEWMTRYEMDPTIGLLIGGELEFPTFHTIKYDKADLMGDSSMYETLESLVEASIETAYKKFSEYKHTPDDVMKIKGLEHV
jgi:hypothetical protein